MVTALEGRIQGKGQNGCNRIKRLDDEICKQSCAQMKKRAEDTCTLRTNEWDEIVQMF
jgi:hypothetical protein